MNMRLRATALVVAALVVCTAAVLVATDEPSNPEDPLPEKREPRTGVTHLEEQVEAVGQVVWQSHLEVVQAWRRQVEQAWWHNTWIPAVNAELDAQRVADQEAAQQRAREQYVPSSSGGSCAIPQHICDRESGGDPNVYSPDGTYWGKYQFSRPTWEANCQGGWGTASEAQQDACAADLYDGGAGAGHWGG